MSGHGRPPAIHSDWGPYTPETCRIVSEARRAGWDGCAVGAPADVDVAFSILADSGWTVERVDERTITVHTRPYCPVESWAELQRVWAAEDAFHAQGALELGC